MSRLKVVMPVLMSLCFSSCAVFDAVGVASDADYAIRNEFIHQGRVVDAQMDHSKNQTTLTFSDGKQYAVDAVVSKEYFLALKYFEIWKEKKDNKIAYRTYQPAKTLLHEGVVIRVQYGKDTTAVDFENGIGYELSGRSEIKPGDKIKVIEIEKEMFFERD